ncbi:unnamed protein product [Dicrocoelium dendriticum]|nr:unnamed protein product [Dicrocoelium dendriticum]
MLGRKLFVGGLNPVTDDFKLKEFYSQYGTVTDAIVMKDFAGRSRGFGFVTFGDSHMTDNACDNRPHEIDGRVVDAKKAVPRGESHPEPDIPVNKIFIGGLRRNLRNEDLVDHFSQYGVIVEAVVMIDKETNHSRGFGFVTFNDTDSVDRVVAAGPHTIGGSSVDVKKAMPRDDTKGGRKNHSFSLLAAAVGSNSAPTYPQWTQSVPWSPNVAPPSAPTELLESAAPY